jgi:hypothetical protein
LIEAIRAAKQLQHLDSGVAGIGIMRSQQPLSTVQPETRNIVLTALQAAVYGEGVKQRLDKLMQDACDWVGDYVEYNSQPSDRHLCDGSTTEHN